jgi:Sec-independent protein secretion pathway component TatC
MLFLAAPMVALYFLAAGISFLHDRRKTKAASRSEDSLLVAPIPVSTLLNEE